MKMSHFIALPANARLRAQLVAKLPEYKGRRAGKGKDWEYTHPELAHKFYSGYRDACYKVEVLSAILSSRTPVDTHQLSLELAIKYGENFSLEQFSNACGVIASYCGGQTDGQIGGGTGLPEPELVPA